MDVTQYANTKHVNIKNCASTNYEQAYFSVFICAKTEELAFNFVQHPF